MAAIRLVLGDQCTAQISSLDGFAEAEDVVLMAEVKQEASYVPHHPKKIAFLFSVMRHFAADQRALGREVLYFAYEDGFASLEDAVATALSRTGADRIIVTECGEWRLQNEIAAWEKRLGAAVEIRADNRFFVPTKQFARWAEGRKSLVMEHFYRWQRRETGLLMEDGQPTGGQWNYDQENRKSLPKGERPPPPFGVKPDAITSDVLTLVEQEFSHHFGELDGFDLAVTAADAEKALDDFIENRLIKFGAYQDALVEGEAFLYHSRLSSYLNAGLLQADDVCRRAAAALEDGAPINSVEGFIRQILGWREYVRGLYWLKMPSYKESNHFDADRPLPGFFWGADTDMACIRDVVKTTQEHAYAHHIQRLMITGNFALVAGLDPKAVQDWYLAVYADAFEWVELPNTHGMALFADGGVMATKPYAASGAYINRMSNHCAKCRYAVKQRTGPDSCPFNSLYWDFLARNEGKLRSNHRMGMIYRTWDRFSEGEQRDIRATAAKHLESLT